MQKFAQEIRQIKVSELVKSAKNVRTHSETQVAQIAASIREFGFTNPVLVDADNVIIAGHGRVLAARLLGMKKVPTIRIDYMTEAQKRAYVIADNKLALNAGWDEELLALELGELREQSFDLALTGFNDAELKMLALGPRFGENDPAAEWAGMPEFDQPNARAFRSIIIHFKQQEDVDQFADLTGIKLTHKTRFAWFPFTEIETFADKAYVDEGAEVE